MEAKWICEVKKQKWEEKEREKMSKVVSSVLDQWLQKCSILNCAGSIEEASLISPHSTWRHQQQSSSPTWFVFLARWLNLRARHKLSPSFRLDSFHDLDMKWTLIWHSLCRTFCASANDQLNLLFNHDYKSLLIGESLKNLDRNLRD